MYSCSECGHKSVKWTGKCPSCGTWESFVEEKETTGPGKRLVLRAEKGVPVMLKDVEQNQTTRLLTGLEEFDRLLGGGLVNGEIILVGGEPGVGKSTLLLEVASRLSAQDKTLYVSVEESPQQVHIRAKRLADDCEKIFILAEDNVDEVYEHVKTGGYRFVVIDSIQVVYSPRCDGLKGSISQIRGCAEILTGMAKSLGVVVFVVGHVTKDGIIAGPKLLEHLVDCVLYFENESLSSYRILRATKNRFGPAGEIAVFEMVSGGLVQVLSTTQVFLPHKDSTVAGSCVVCVSEGSRPLIMELQALVSKAGFQIVRRRSLGYDFNRFSLLVAIIEKKLKLPLSGEDVFLNAAGGLKINDPAADLGAAMAIVSSHKDKPAPAGCAFLGEVGLAGELRRIAGINQRLKELSRMGFKACFIPESNREEVDAEYRAIAKPASTLEQLVEKIF